MKLSKRRLVGIGFVAAIIVASFSAGMDFALNDFCYLPPWTLAAATLCFAVILAGLYGYMKEVELEEIGKGGG